MPTKPNISQFQPTIKDHVKTLHGVLQCHQFPRRSCESLRYLQTQEHRLSHQGRSIAVVYYFRTDDALWAESILIKKYLLLHAIERVLS